MSEAVLYLAVKREYFEAIQSGEKVEEFRLTTDFWKKRISGKLYDFVEITLGYPKREDKSCRMRFKWNGYKIKTIIHPHFDNKPNEVFAICLRNNTHDR